MKRRIVLTAGAVVALGASTAAAFGLGAGGVQTPSGDTQPPKTVDVTRITLIDYAEFNGQLGYGEVLPLRHLAGGVSRPAYSMLATRQPPGTPNTRRQRRPMTPLIWNVPSSA